MSWVRSVLSPKCPYTNETHIKGLHKLKYGQTIRPHIGLYNKFVLFRPEFMHTPV